MNPIFFPAARSELFEAVEYYEGQLTGLGCRFAAAVEEAVARIMNDPTSWETVEGEIRRCRVKSFPYALLFSMEATEVVIVAVMHLHRNPGYWKDRVDG